MKKKTKTERVVNEMKRKQTDRQTQEETKANNYNIAQTCNR